MIYLNIPSCQCGQESPYQRSSWRYQCGPECVVRLEEWCQAECGPARWSWPDREGGGEGTERSGVSVRPPCTGGSPQVLWTVNTQEYFPLQGPAQAGTGDRPLLPGQLQDRPPDQQRPGRLLQVSHCQRFQTLLQIKNSSRYESFEIFYIRLEGPQLLPHHPLNECVDVDVDGAGGDGGGVQRGGGQQSAGRAGEGRGLTATRGLWGRGQTEGGPGERGQHWDWDQEREGKLLTSLTSSPHLTFLHP